MSDGGRKRALKVLYQFLCQTPLDSSLNKLKKIETTKLGTVLGLVTLKRGEVLWGRKREGFGFRCVIKVSFGLVETWE